MKKQKIIVTGANGYVGSSIAAYLRKNGCVVYEMGRHKSSKVSDKKLFIPFELGKPVDAAAFRGKDTLIHCAYDFKLKTWPAIRKINIQGSIDLLRAARKSGVKKIIFISSFSAFEGAKSMYGQSKLAIEKAAARLGAYIIRPPLIYGKNAGGTVGGLNRLIASSSIVPLVGLGSQKFYMCHVGDLAKLVLEISRKNIKTEAPITAAPDKPFTLRQVISVLAAAKGKKVVFVPIPYWMLYSGLKLLELIGIKTRLRSDSIVSVLNRNPRIDFTETKKFKTVFRDFNPKTANQAAALL